MSTLSHLQRRPEEAREADTNNNQGKIQLTIKIQTYNHFKMYLLTSYNAVFMVMEMAGIVTLVSQCHTNIQTLSGDL